MAFTPVRALLNPKFEGYKLHPISQTDAVCEYALPTAVTQATVSGRSLLSFEEVSSRITHNHLAVGPQGRVMYIDSQWGVHLVVLDEDTHQPSFHRVFELPRTIQSDDSAVGGEYPSAAALDHAHWVVSDGLGRFYVVKTVADLRRGVIEGVLLLYTEMVLPASDGGASPLLPCQLHHAMLLSPGTARLVLSSKTTGKSFHGDATRSTQFDVWGVQLQVPLSPESSLVPMDVLWCRTGGHIPLYVSFDPSRNDVIVVGRSQYHESGITPIVPPDPTPDELAPIPQANEDLQNKTLPAKPPPYSWTQASDSVTLAFPLPSSTPKASIKVHFSPRTLSVSVQDPSGILSAASSLDLPRYSLAQLWDGISPSSSFWTWDSEGERTFGLLTLHLDKQHEGTRWPQLFTEAWADEARNVEVPETLDPSELWNIRESLEKYTASLREGRDVSGLGLGTGVPSLAAGEMDDELDSSIGSPVYLTYIHGDGISDPQPLGVPVTLLCTPLPCADTPPSLLIKHDIDALLFELSPSATGRDVQWVHKATYPALAFVLASKRDTRFTYHISSQVVLAFDAGSLDIGGNIYLYRGSTTGSKWAASAVLRIGGGPAGVVLGVGAVRTASGQLVVLGLCERELVVIQGVA